MTDSIFSDLNSSPLPYIQSEAGASLSKKGEVLSQGLQMTRLKLGGDSRFYVAVHIVHSGQLANYILGKLGQLLGYYVEIKNGKDTIFININSIAKRLHVKKSDIYQAVEQGTLLSLLNQRSQSANSTLVGYEKILKNFGEESQTGLSTKIILKVIRIAVMKEKSLYQPLNIQGQTYYLGFDQNTQEVELAHLDAVFASGTFGEVRRFTHVFKDSEEVFKQARLTQGMKARKDVENEYKQLKALHDKGKLWGIQAPPRRIFEIKEGGQTKFGYLGMQYEGDYLDTINNNAKAKLENLLGDFHQLLSGLKALANQNVLHGDLKPENIFVKKDQDGTQLIHIADLGGARTATSSESLSNLPGADRSFTPGYSAHEDLILADELARQGKYEELVDLEKKRDVFSMGVVLQAALTQELAYLEKPYGFPNLNSYLPINRADVPQEMKDLIKSMVDPDYQKRPSAEEAFNRFDAFFQNAEPNLYAKIQTKIQSEYPGSVFP